MVYNFDFFDFLTKTTSQSTPDVKYEPNTMLCTCTFGFFLWNILVENPIRSTVKATFESKRA